MILFQVESQIFVVVNHSKVFAAASRIAGRGILYGRAAVTACGRSSGSGRCITCGTGSGALAVCARNKIDLVSNHFYSSAVVAVFVLILAGLQAAFHNDRATLLEVLAHKLGLLTPCDNVDKISLTLLTLTGKVAVNSNSERCYAGSLRGLAQLRIRHKATHQNNNIQHFVLLRAKTYSASATIIVRRTPSVILYTRSSSAGKAGSLVNLITV